MPLDGDEQEQDDQQQDGGGGAAEPAWAKALGENIGGLTATMRELMANARQSQQQQSSQGDDDDDGGENEPSAEDLETMDRATFGAHLVGQVLKAVNKQVVAPLNAQIAAITASTTKNEIQSSVKELAAANKDFWDWKDDMIALAHENRGIAPKRLLQLARADNPKKAAELEKKYNPQSSQNGTRPRLSFGGMTPSQSGTGSRTRTMKPTDAATAAWQETVAALGGEPLFEDE